MAKEERDAHVHQPERGESHACFEPQAPTGQRPGGGGAGEGRRGGSKDSDADGSQLAPVEEDEFRVMFTYAPRDVPTAMPATPRCRINRNAEAAETATDTAAILTGVLVSPRA
jgi:hypothetical protein